MSVTLTPVSEVDGEGEGGRVGVTICDTEIDQEKEESKVDVGNKELDPQGE